MSAMIAAIRMASHIQPDRPAIDSGIGPVIRYDELEASVAELANSLRQSWDIARPVALQLDHGPQTCVLELALLEAGLPVLSLPAFFTQDQISHSLLASGAQALFGADVSLDIVACQSAPVPMPTGTARITFTSGSTGAPAGICLSAAHLLEVAQAVVSRVGKQHAGRHLALLPPGILLETVAGFFATLLGGGTYVAPPQASLGMADPFRPNFPEMAAAIARLEITSLILVPEYLAGLVRHMEQTGLRLPLLTLVAVGGARTSPDLIARARALGLPVRQGYGLTECGSVVALEGSVGDPPGSVGQALDHMRIRLADDGEILVEGSLCLGTLGGGAPASPFPTGDIGRIDGQGKLWIEGRKSNLIVTSYGRNIAPEWIEELLLAQPGIAQACAYGEGLAAPEALIVPADPELILQRLWRR